MSGIPRDGRGGVKIAVGANAHSSALEKSHVVSTVPCVLRQATALNNSVADVWLHIFDLTSLPANGTVPSRTPIPVPAGDVNGIAWEGGTVMAVGCVLALSSTLATLTLIAGNDGLFDSEVVP